MITIVNLNKLPLSVINKLLTRSFAINFSIYLFGMIVLANELSCRKFKPFRMEVNELNSSFDYITKEDVKKIVESYAQVNCINVLSIEQFQIYNASDKLLGFLADYLKLKTHVKVRKSDSSEELKVLPFFVKAVSRVNAAKAACVKDNNLFSKEVQFYSLIKKKIDIPGLGNWSPNVYAILNDAIVFEDLHAKNYQVANKMKRFDLNHTKCALRALAKFHASSIAYTNLRYKQLNRQFDIEEDFINISHRVKFYDDDPWYFQCMKSSLSAILQFSKYGKDQRIRKVIEQKWPSVWSTGEFEYPTEKLKAICHRDLWNNNIMFKYEDADNNDSVPQDTVFVDFQAIGYQPPVTDVMMLLYCNLDPEYREANMVNFLEYYYHELGNFLNACSISLESIVSRVDFFMCAEKCRKWGLITCACLLPAVHLSDRTITDIFSDSERFNEILFEKKSEFVIKMMNELPDYKSLMLQIFEEIVERYCINDYFIAV